MWKLGKFQPIQKLLNLSIEFQKVARTFLKNFIRLYKSDLMSRLLEIKSDKPKLIIKQTARQLGYSYSAKKVRETK